MKKLLILLCIVGCNNTNTIDIGYNNILDKAQKQKQDIFVLVGATWCGPCQQMKQDIEKFNLIKGYIFYYIDSDKNPDILKKLNINNIPTYFIVNSKGEILKRKSGYTNKNDLIQFLARKI